MPYPASSMSESIPDEKVAVLISRCRKAPPRGSLSRRMMTPASLHDACFSSFGAGIARGKAGCVAGIPALSKSSPPQALTLCHHVTTRGSSDTAELLLRRTPSYWATLLMRLLPIGAKGWIMLWRKLRSWM